jgi:glucokinase
VLAITAGQSPLAKKADVTLVVDPVEDVARQVPMVGRILHLLMIDMLAVGVAMKRGVTGPDARLPEASELAAGQPEPRPAAAQRAAPGVSAAGPLARLTSHSG